MQSEDICAMSDRYIDAVRAHNHVEHLPIVLAHDGQQSVRAAEITRKYNALSYNGANANIVDMLLLARATYSILNPSSTMSGHVACARVASGLRSTLGDTDADMVRWYMQGDGGMPLDAHDHADVVTGSASGEKLKTAVQRTNDRKKVWQQRRRSEEMQAPKVKPKVTPKVSKGDTARRTNRPGRAHVTGPRWSGDSEPGSARRNKQDSCYTGRPLAQRKFQ